MSASGDRVTEALGNMLVKVQEKVDENNLRKDDVCIVMTGGFKIMASAVTLAGLMLGIEVVFRPESKQGLVNMPRLKLVPDLAVWKKYYRALDTLHESHEHIVDWSMFMRLAYHSEIKHYVEQELQPFVRKIQGKPQAKLTEFGDMLVKTAHAQYRDDRLTRAWRRKFIQDCLLSDLKKAEAIGVAMLDLDHFKKVNDDHGHQIGDEVLKAFVRVIQAALQEWESLETGRKGELIRWGGEEFIIIINRGQEICEVSESIRKTMSDHNVYKDIHVTVSAGATWDMIGAQDIGSLVDLLKDHADELVYEAKGDKHKDKNGRNRVICKQLINKEKDD